MNTDTKDLMPRLEREKQYQALLDQFENAQDETVRLILSIPDQSLQDALFAAMDAENRVMVEVDNQYNTDPDFREYATAHTILKYGSPQATSGEHLH